MDVEFWSLRQEGRGSESTMRMDVYSHGESVCGVCTVYSHSGNLSLLTLSSPPVCSPSSPFPILLRNVMRMRRKDDDDDDKFPHISYSGIVSMHTMHMYDSGRGT